MALKNRYNRCKRYFQQSCRLRKSQRILPTLLGSANIRGSDRSGHPSRDIGAAIERDFWRSCRSRTVREPKIVGLEESTVRVNCQE